MSNVEQTKSGLVTGDPEDRRAAVNISVNLSSYLITAALTMLAVVGAFSTYLLDKRVPSTLFWLAFWATIVTFVASIFLGGRGAARAYTRGHMGDWSLTASSKLFNLQAIACLVGLLAFAAMIGATSPKEDDTAPAITRLQQTVEEQRRTQQDSYRTLHARVRQLQQQLDSLKEARAVQPSGRKTPRPQNRPAR